MIPITDGVIDLEQRTVRRRGGTESLTPTEAALLAYLAERTEPSDRAMLLQEVWGYHPSVESRTVFNAVRRLRMKIEIDPGAPVHLLTVRGAGYRFQATPSSDIGVDAFFGRQGDLEKIGERLEKARLVTVVGPGGIGKTRLVQRYLHQIPGIFCDLQDARNEVDLRASVALALGVTPEQLEESLANGERLLVLDNVEQIVDVLGAVLPGWLEHRCILATSRIPLGIWGEALHALTPLPMEAATAMFEDRVDAASTGHRGQGALIKEIVERLEGHPLALELAAARVRLLGLEALNQRLSLDLLKTEGADRPARHRSIRAMLQWSFEQLDPPEKEALCILAAFRGGFDLAAAEALVDLDRLEALIAASLLQADGGRFRMLALVRAFAEEQGSPGVDAHRDYFLHRYAKSGAGLEASTAEERRDLRLDMDNLLVIVERFPGTDEGTRALLCALRHLENRLPLATRIARVEQALDWSNVPGTRVLIRLQYSHLLLQNERIADARIAAHEALELSDDSIHEALSVCEMARVESRTGDHRAARDLNLRALPICEAGGLSSLVANCHSNLATCQQDLGEQKLAKASLEQAIALHRELGNLRNEANCLQKLATLDRANRTYEETAAMYRQSIAILHEVGDVVYLVRALKPLAVLERQEGNLDEATRIQEEVVAGFREVGRLLDVAFEGLILGRILELAGERDQAVEYYRACLEHGIAADNNILRGMALGHLGELDAARRELQDHAMFLTKLDDWLDERPW